MSFFELAAVAVTLAAVYLTTRQIVWCWPLGLVSVSMYAVIFYEAKLYADMGLQGFYFLLSIYGWWAWLHGGEDRRELVPRFASGRARFLGLVIAAAFALTLGTLLHRWTDASLPYMDSTLTSFSLLAQFFATRKLVENWLIWIAVDVFYVGMFLFKGLSLTAGLYGAFLLLAAIGWSEWRKKLGEMPLEVGQEP